MSRDWETTFSTWAQKPPKSEEDRSESAIKAIREAIGSSTSLNARSIQVFVHGSYRNRVNVRKDSDVDVGVMCDDFFIPYYPEGTTKETFGNMTADYGYSDFKRDLEAALVAHFGRGSVRRGNKAFTLFENDYLVNADVAPFAEYRRYWESGSYRCGVALRPDLGSVIHNYPERLRKSWPSTPQHYENGVSKNKATGRTYKGLVRVIKSLRNEMSDAGVAAAEPIPGFLLECMAWNCSNSCFNKQSWRAVVEAVLSHIWAETKDEKGRRLWMEVNDCKYLFHRAQPWSPEQARAFIKAAWNYIGA